MFQDDGAIRVIEGPENLGEVATGDGEYEVEPDVLASKFKKFIREFKYNAPDAGTGNILTMKYRDQFQNNCEQGYYYLEINLNDLDTPDGGEVLAHCLKQRPSAYLPVCERSLKELYMEMVKKDGDSLPAKAPNIQLMLTYDIDLDGSFGTMKPLKIRQLTSDQVEKLVVIQGIVVSAKKSRHKARKVCLKCSNCENYREVFVGAGFTAGHIPGACDGNNLARGPMEKCPPNPFVIVDELCEYADEQILKLQELPDHVPVGEMPRHVDLCVSQYLVDRASPGARLTAIGVFCATEHSTGDRMGGGRQKGTDTVKYSYLQVLGAQVSQGSAVEISADDEERFEQMARDPDIRAKIYKSIAPAICASDKDVIDEVKKAVACMLFGGSRKLLPDGTRMRGDINVLLLGDPGTAKSQFLKFSEKAAPVAVYTSGKGSSAAGLTAAIVKEKDGFALEGGAMVLADGGVVCIDEFDKMDVKDRVAIHEAMEQQTISIAKAGITTMLNTRCSVLAAANPRFGTYDDLTNTADQMDFETTILSRFDMMFLVKDVRDPDRDYNLAMHMAALHKGEVMEEAEGPLPIADLRKFLSYCRRRCAPRLTAAAGEVLKNHYVSIRAKMKQEKETGKDSGIPITVRQLEAIIRISESLAKMELCEDVNIGHVEEALRLFTVSTLDSANRDRGVGVDTLSEEEKTELHKAEEQIRRRVQRGGRINRYQLESWLVSAGGVDERMARRAIYLMLMRQEFVERANATLQRV
jgi:DNA replication licensing factor MCM5